MARLSVLLTSHEGARLSSEQWQQVADALDTGRTIGSVKQKAQQIKKAAEAAEEAGGLAVRAEAVTSGIHPNGVGPPSAPAQGGIKRQSGPRISLPGMAPRKMLASQANKAEWAAKVDAAAKAAAAAAGAEADTDYDVSEILGIRTGWDDQGHDDSSFEFQVKWSTGDISWEPIIMLENCRDLVKKFLDVIRTSEGCHRK